MVPDDVIARFVGCLPVHVRNVANSIAEFVYLVGLILNPPCSIFFMFVFGTSWSFGRLHGKLDVSSPRTANQSSHFRSCAIGVEFFWQRWMSEFDCFVQKATGFAVLQAPGQVSSIAQREDGVKSLSRTFLLYRSRLVAWHSARHFGRLRRFLKDVLFETISLLGMQSVPRCFSHVRRVRVRLWCSFFFLIAHWRW